MARYLMATDLSESSQNSENYVSTFLEPSGVTIHLLTVIDLFDEGKIREFTSELNPEKLQKRHEQRALEELRPLADRLAEDGFEAELEAIHGRPGPEICRRAEELDVSGIFLGRGKHSRLGEVFQGSVSRYVVLNAKQSVIVTPT